MSGLQPIAEKREELGWSLVSVSLITVFVNFAKLIFVKVRTLAKHFTKNKTLKINIIEKS